MVTLPPGVRLFRLKPAGIAALSRSGGIGSDELDIGKVGAVARGLAGNQRQASDERMGSDVKVRHRGSPRTTAFAVLEEGARGHKRRFPREIQTFVHRAWKVLFHLARRLVKCGNFGKDD